MTDTTTNMTTTLREQLADLEHEQWAHWTRYMLDNLTPENIERWRRQCDTPYAELTEREKDSDREWADKVLALVAAPVQRHPDAIEFQFQLENTGGRELKAGMTTPETWLHHAYDVACRSDNVRGMIDAAVALDTVRP